VSLATGEAVLAVLVDLGWDAQAIYVDHDLDLCVRQARIDLAFVALHGRGADGPAQGLLESLGVPYTGPSLAAASLAADKLKTKELLRLHNLPTPTYYCHARGQGRVREQHGAFGFPCVVKPRSGGSGIGVALARDWDELDAAIEIALRLDDDVLVERHVTGREVQVVLLDGEVIGAAEVGAEGVVLDYALRYGPSGRVPVVVPPRLGAERIAGVITQAERAQQLVGCDGLVRVDVLVSEQGNESVLEVNALPDLGPPSLVPKVAHAMGLEFGALCERMLLGARLRNGRRSRHLGTPAAVRAMGERRIGMVERH
jgi:D-alanine-D-alanine ligase